MELSSGATGTTSSALVERVFCATTSGSRLAAARAWLAGRCRRSPLWIAGSDADTGRELIRSVLGSGESAFGWRSGGLFELARELAGPELARRVLVPARSDLLSSLCSRVLAEAASEGTLTSLAALADSPGMPHALVRSFSELRGLGDSTRLETKLPEELSGLLIRYEKALEEEGLVDEPALFQMAINVLTDPSAEALGRPQALLLVAPDCASPLERAFVRELLFRTEDALLVLPSSDGALRTMLELAADAEILDRRPKGDTDLARLQSFLFSEARPPQRSPDRSVLLMSAPGERRECVEIVRRIQRAAGEGVRYDRIAVLIRDERSYRVPLEEALRRAAIPAHFASGSSLPDRSGRALALLLECRAEGLSVERFSEYLSLEQLGSDVDHRAWERLLEDSAAIGGLERIERRLAAHVSEYQVDQLELLRERGLPLLRFLAGLPTSAPWASWADHLDELAAIGLEDSDCTAALSADLRLRGSATSVSLAALRTELERKLGERRVAPAHRAHGAVFVGRPEDARGRSFVDVYIPGLSEGGFPRKVVEDPLLLDPLRVELSPDLDTNADRAAAERRALQLSVAAAESSVTLSWSRLDGRAGRPRVPSFYALEVVRASQGLLPSFERLAEEADKLGGARLAWPAPEDPADAIDAAEHDLSLFARVRRRTESEARGTMRYLLGTNPNLARSLRVRARRWNSRKIGPSDGLVEPREQGLRAIQGHRLTERSYSPTSLQRYARCPYSFFLGAILGLKPRASRPPSEQLAPRARGSMIHEIQFETLSGLRNAALLPLEPADYEHAAALLDQAVETIRGRYLEELAPTTDWVWDGAISEIRADLREWLRRLAVDRTWTPLHFELGFGISGERRCDPMSRDEAVKLSSGLHLRGSMDLVEVSMTSAGGRQLRVTDHKAGGEVPPKGVEVGGGEVLQPALYALVLEVLFPESADPQAPTGRLDYCTSQGEFIDRDVPISSGVRRSVKLLSESLELRLDIGSFPALPRLEACKDCDFRLVCGPHEEFRMGRKDRSSFDDIHELRLRR